VPEACSIDRTSLCSVARALESDVLDELLELPELLVEVDAVAEVAAMDEEASVAACEWCVCTMAATWCAA